MSKKKTYLYHLSNTSDLLITPAADFSIAYKWKRKNTFGYDKIVLELACGKGHYTIWLAERDSQSLYIGIDIKWDRFARRMEKAKEKWLQNVRFIRGIIQHLDRRFAPGEIDEIWIVHPDPRPRESDERRRLTFSRFLKMYESLLVPGGKVKLKTDAQELFAYSVQSFAQESRTCLAETRDLHHSDLLAEHYGIVTDYEKLALDRGEPIAYGVWQKNMK